MNKVMIMGRLTRDPEVRYTQSATPTAVTRYAVAVRRPFPKQGQPDVDFFNIVAFGKAGEFAEKYFKKGQQVAIVGRLQINNWEDDKQVKHTSVDVIVEEQHFAGAKNENGGDTTGQGSGATPSPQVNVPAQEDDDLPF